MKEQSIISLVNFDMNGKSFFTKKRNLYTRRLILKEQKQYSWQTRETFARVSLCMDSIKKIYGLASLLLI